MAIAVHPTVASTTLPLLTYEAYLTEGEVSQPYDIINGVRYFMASPRWRHQRIQLKISRLLARYEEAAHSGMVVTAPFDVLIRRAPLQTRQPDVLFISNARLEQVGGVPEEGRLEVAPELTVEILSPSETPRSLLSKIEDYCAIGVLECWIVSPEAETVEVRRLSLEGMETVAVYAFSQMLQSITFADLAFPVADIFVS